MKNRIRRHLTALPRQKKISFAGLMGTLVIPGLIALAATLVLPENYLKNFYYSLIPENSFISSLSDFASEKDSIKQINTMAIQINSLKIEEAFWNNRLLLAERDSVTMSVDLQDSLIILEMGGVPVRYCRILQYSSNLLLDYFKQYPQVVQWMSSPFILQNEKASIPKKPIKVIHAPKDPVEAEVILQKILENEDEDDIYFMLDFDRKLTLEIMEPSPPKIAKPQFSGMIKSNEELLNTFAEYHNRLNDHIKSRQLQISLVVSEADARAVYRALPKKAELALRF